MDVRWTQSPFHSGGNGWAEALSDHYLKVRLAGRHAANKILKIDIKELGEQDLVAVAAEQNYAVAVSRRTYLPRGSDREILKRIS
ncbi:MAG TPA: hypothetical protein VGK22_04575 [Candidatus Angelobacter sp.]